MPEGPVVHRVANEQRTLVGSAVEVRTAGDTATGVLVAIEAIGKHLLYHFDDRTLHVHLGVRGEMARDTRSSDRDRAGESVRLQGQAGTWVGRGAAVVEWLDADSVQALRMRLGPDPLRADADRDVAFARLRVREGPIADALVDQTVVAGTGNVLRSEVLHELGLDPMTPARSIDRPLFDHLWEIVGSQMRTALESPPPDTRVYRRKRCRTCGRPVQRAAVRDRTVYFCPNCQHRMRS